MSAEEKDVVAFDIEVSGGDKTAILIAYEKDGTQIVDTLECDVEEKSSEAIVSWDQANSVSLIEYFKSRKKVELRDDGIFDINGHARMIFGMSRDSLLLQDWNTPQLSARVHRSKSNWTLQGVYHAPRLHSQYPACLEAIVKAGVHEPDDVEAVRDFRLSVCDRRLVASEDSAALGVVEGGLSMDSSRALPPFWSYGVVNQYNHTIQVARGSCWLQVPQSSPWLKTDQGSIYVSASPDEIHEAKSTVLASDLNAGLGDTVGEFTTTESIVDDKKISRPTHFKQWKIDRKMTAHAAEFEAKPRLNIPLDLAERLHPYINPFAFRQLATPHNRRDLAPPMDVATYDCVYTRKTFTLASLRDALLTKYMTTKLDVHQIESLDYALTGDDTYIADDAGTGKTITALAVAVCQHAQRVLIVGPSSSKYNWDDEIKKFLVYRAHTIVVDSDGPYASEEALSHELTKVFASTNRGEPVYVVINYDIVDRVINTLSDITWDLLVVDEAKRLQYDDSKRSILLTGGIMGRGGAKRRYPGLTALKRLFMDGTPINKPFQFWPIVRAFDPQGLGADKVKFCDTYCGAYVDQMGRYQYSGKTDLKKVQELGVICRQRFMVRHADTVLDLKPCTEEVVFIEPNNREELETDERNAIMNALQKLRDRDKEQGDETAREILSEVAKRGGSNEALREVVGQTFGEQLTSARARGPITQILLEEMASVRRKLGAAKVEPSLDFIMKVWEENDYEPLLIFGHHKDDVVKKIGTELADRMFDHLSHAKSEAGQKLFRKICDHDMGVGALVTGDISAKKKGDIKRRFQNGELLFIVANIAAAGEALTLTRSHLVFFVESDWNATMMRQARKRAHRRGQEFPVHVYLLFVDQSFDYTVVSKFLLKRDVQDAFFSEGMWSASGDDEDDELDD